MAQPKKPSNVPALDKEELELLRAIAPFSQQLNMFEATASDMPPINQIKTQADLIQVVRGSPTSRNEVVERFIHEAESQFPLPERTGTPVEQNHAPAVAKETPKTAKNTLTKPIQKPMSKKPTIDDDMSLDDPVAELDREAILEKIREAHEHIKSAHAVIKELYSLVK